MSLICSECRAREEEVERLRKRVADLEMLAYAQVEKDKSLEHWLSEAEVRLRRVNFCAELGDGRGEGSFKEVSEFSVENLNERNSTNASADTVIRTKGSLSKNVTSSSAFGGTKKEQVSHNFDSTIFSKNSYQNLQRSKASIDRRSSITKSIHPVFSNKGRNIIDFTNQSSSDPVLPDSAYKRIREILEEKVQVLNKNVEDFLVQIDMRVAELIKKYASTVASALKNPGKKNQQGSVEIDQLKKNIRASEEALKMAKMEVEELKIKVNQQDEHHLQLIIEQKRAKDKLNEEIQGLLFELEHWKSRRSSNSNPVSGKSTEEIREKKYPHSQSMPQPGVVAEKESIIKLIKVKNQIASAIEISQARKTTKRGRSHEKLSELPQDSGDFVPKKNNETLGLSKEDSSLSSYLNAVGEVRQAEVLTDPSPAESDNPYAGNQQTYSDKRNEEQEDNYSALKKIIVKESAQNQTRSDLKTIVHNELIVPTPKPLSAQSAAAMEEATPPNSKKKKLNPNNFFTFIK